MFDRQFPHALIHHPDPIFEREFQRLGKPATREELTAYDLKTIILLHIGAWGLLFGLAGSVSLIFGPYGWGDPAVSLFFRGTIGFAIFGLAIIASGIVSDLYYMAATVLNARGAVHSVEWDMLRLTAIPGACLLASQLAIVQIRAWRFMTLETVARIVMLEPFIVGGYAIYTSSRACLGCSRNVITYDNSGLPLFAMMIIVSATLILEPLWRMRALTTCGLLISLQSDDSSQNILKAAALALSSSVIRLAVWLPVLYVVVPQFGYFFVPGESPEIYPFLGLIGAIALFRLIYNVYAFLQRRVARRAAFLIDSPS